LWKLSFASPKSRTFINWERFRFKRQSAKWVDKDDKTETEAKELKPLLGQNWGWANNLVLLKDGSGFLFLGGKSRGDGRLMERSLRSLISIRGAFILVFPMMEKLLLPTTVSNRILI